MCCCLVLLSLPFMLQPFRGCLPLILPLFSGLARVLAQSMIWNISVAAWLEPQTVPRVSNFVTTTERFLSHSLVFLFPNLSCGNHGFERNLSDALVHLFRSFLCVCFRGGASRNSTLGRSCSSSMPVTARLVCCFVSALNVLLVVSYYKGLAVPVFPNSSSNRPVRVATDLRERNNGNSLHKMYVEQHGHGESGDVVIGVSARVDGSQPEPEFVSSGASFRLPSAVLRILQERSATPRRRQHLQHAKRVAVPLVPPSMLLDFTMNATVPLVYEYDDSAAAHTTQRHSSESNHSLVHAWRSMRDRTFRKVPKQRLVSIYAELLDIQSHDSGTPTSDGSAADVDFRKVFLQAVESLKAFIRHRDVLVLSTSEEPVIEVAMLTIGEALSVHTAGPVPYEMEDSRFTSYDIDTFWSTIGDARTTNHVPYDCIVSYRTVQHDGLGRFGDEVDPWGDVRAMAEVWSLLRPGGLLILGVAVGNDCVVFNLHRVYGRRRLPLLLAGWKVVSAYGFGPADLFTDNTCDTSHVPILILQRIDATAPLTENISNSEAFKDVPGLYGPLPLYSKAKVSAL